MPHTDPAESSLPGRETLTLTLAGRTWRIEREGDLETLWNSLDEETPDAEDHIPYWVEMWPAGVALAAMLAERKDEIAGRACLDVGCGLAVTALVASWLGARVVAFDIMQEALSYGRDNAALNGVPQPLWLRMDWRYPAVRKGAFPFIFGGDVIYEKRFFEPLDALFRHALAPGGRVWLGEARRDVSKPFPDRFRERGWLVERVGQEKRTSPTSSMTVNLWELRLE
ncbi:ribosomal L11 methyltransferase [Desulfovibrio sp. X2]|uniref:class I SAM-dependent methyltransferase n=1 Tax=Desulfovibrio sp. X2 TaxID=941449 RepID=UPI000358BE15|nr:50S ribosomal protein L11 methyltransferase [Desulfovibrio sp. X2]EPR44254.1 ribosomal L11 methyltransferase [Desulfovibrio sp. X2]